MTATAHDGGGLVHLLTDLRGVSGREMELDRLRARRGRNDDFDNAIHETRVYRDVLKYFHDGLGAGVCWGLRGLVAWERLARAYGLKGLKHLLRCLLLAFAELRFFCQWKFAWRGRVGAHR